jgi:hypothetical protein
MIKFFILILLPILTWANPLKDLTVESDKSPYEFVILTAHLKQHLKDDWKRFEFIQNLKTIQQEISKLEDTDALSMIKIFIYQGILDTPLISYKRNVQAPSSNLVINATNKLENYKKEYTDLEKWIIESLLSDWEKKKEDLPIYSRMSLWLSEFEKNAPNSFHKRVTLIASDLINQLAIKLSLQNKHAVQQNKSPAAVQFNLPDIKRPLVKQLKSLEEERRESVQELKKSVEKVQADDLSEASKAIDKLQKAKTYRWKPKD